MSTYEGTVEADDVLQDESPATVTIPVSIDAPVRTQALPSRAAGCTTINVGTTGARACAPDPRRKKVTIYAFDQEIRISDSQAGSASSMAARWPKLVALVLDTSEEVWIASATSTTDVTVIQEAWAH